MANLHERGLSYMERRGGPPSVFHLMVTLESHLVCLSQGDDVAKMPFQVR